MGSMFTPSHMCRDNSYVVVLKTYISYAAMSDNVFLSNTKYSLIRIQL